MKMRKGYLNSCTRSLDSNVHLLLYRTEGKGLVSCLLVPTQIYRCSQYIIICLLVNDGHATRLEREREAEEENSRNGGGQEKGGS